MLIFFKKIQHFPSFDFSIRPKIFLRND